MDFGFYILDFRLIPGHSPLCPPPPLKPGDRVLAIAPSGALQEFTAFEQGIAIWRDRGYHTDLVPYWNARCGYLAGSDSQRREALEIGRAHV